MSDAKRVIAEVVALLCREWERNAQVVASAFAEQNPQPAAAKQ